MSPSTPVGESEPRADRSREVRQPQPSRPALEWLCIPRPPSRDTRWSGT